MNPTIESLGINRLSVRERLVLAQDIIDSVLCDMGPGELTVAQAEELDRRVAAYEADPSRAIPWETVLAQTKARLGS